MGEVPNCSKWFECSDVLSGLVAVMLKGFYLQFFSIQESPALKQWADFPKVRETS